MISRWPRFCVAALLLVPYAVTLAQEISTLDLVKGNYGKYAVTLKLADLPEGYSAVRLAVAATDPMKDLMPLLLAGAGGDSGKMSAQYRISQCSWTNGDVVSSKGREYLVTYKVDWDIFAQLTRGRNFQNSEPPASPSEEPKLKIDLVALNAIEGVEPCPNITKQDLLNAFGSGVPDLDIPGRMAAMQTATLSNAKQIALGPLMYTNDYDDVLPYAQSSNAAWYVEYPYVKNIQIFKTFNPNGGMMRFNMGVSGANIDSVSDPSNTVLIYESQPWPDGRRVVAFVDGHAKLVTSLEWADLSSHLTPPGIKRAKKPLPSSYDSEFLKLPNSPPHGSP